ncbi:MAG: hypothetical protein AMXMBFR13_15720 [Phycisphaerae bacterium]
MKRQQRLVSYLQVAVALAIGGLAGCQPEDLLNAAAGGAVYVLDVDGLEPPAVPDEGVYRPERFRAIDPADPVAGRAVVFSVTVAASAARDLGVRVRREGVDASEGLPKLSLSPPVFDNLPDEAQPILRRGQGAFWVDSAGDGLEHRVGIAMPEAFLDSPTRVEIFDAVAPDGTPFGGAHLKLTSGFFYMAVIGDSVTWGNGLRDSQKFSTLVAEEVERRTGLHVVRQVHAISGTRIVPSPEDIICRVRCNGEVQTASTSITVQVDLIEQPAAQDLILLNGCINDVEVDTILDPETPSEVITDRTGQYCGQEMAALLRKVNSAAPEAAVVVTGYYPIISADSSLPTTLQYVLLRETTEDENTPQLIEKLAANSELFLSESRAGMSAAVAEVSAQRPGALLYYVEPGFGPANALFGPEPWLWGVTGERIEAEELDASLSIFPEDPLAGLRAVGCFGDVLVDPISCLFASVAHPNARGARAYADAILAALYSADWLAGRTSEP